MSEKYLNNKNIMNTHMFEHLCDKCGYPWKSKLAKPKACPRCKQYIRYDKHEIIVKQGGKSK